VLREAEERARKIRHGADAYAVGVLSELEGRLGTALGSVKKGQEALVSRGNAQTAAALPSAPLTEAAAKSKRAAFDAQVEAAQLESVEAHN